MSMLLARARAALVSLFAVLLVSGLAAGCGGNVVHEDDVVRHVRIELRSEKRNGKEVGLPWLEPAIGRAEATAMRSGFSWANTAPIRELDADGAPALYYAAIYLASREQRVMLDQVQIHHSFMPLFAHEQDRWHGKKGKMSASTDGRGAFVFTVVPGRIYNLIRQWALDGDPLFEAVVLRHIPKPMQNAEGSLSYDRLAQARFRYRGMEPIRPQQPGAENLGTSQQKLVILAARLALKAIAEAAEEIPRLVAKALGNRDRDGALFGWGAAGTVNLRLTLEVRDTDPAFGGNPMRRAWGKDAGAPVMLPGVRVSVWSRGDGTVLWLPTLFEATTNADSMATLKMAKDRGVRQLCIATENDAAELTELLTEVEVCDFEGSVDKDIDNLKFDTWATVTVQDGYFNILAQATESRAYLRDVVGYTPHQAVINVGWIADAMGQIGTGGPFVPCLGFPNVSADLIVLPLLGFVGAIPVVGPGLAATLAAATPLLAVDMFFPDSAAMLSRGVATHEYGHFAMCSMLYDASVTYISTSWTGAVLDRITSGAVPPPTASQAYDIEAFADFFSGQVVGGTNYFVPGAAQKSSMSYCDVVVDGATCLDENYSSQSDFHAQVARVATTLHDAFDGDRFDSTFVNRPGNGNAWTFSSATNAFVYDGARNGDAYDEPVLLPGSALRTFVGKLSALSSLKFMTSLAETIRENGYDWCQTCRVFSLHQGVSAGSPPGDHYAACQAAPVASWVGAAPDPSSPTSCNFTQCPYPLVHVGLGCEPCAPNQISVSGTTCLTCPPEAVVVNNQCQICNAGGVCQPSCVERQHMVAGVCQDCPFPEISEGGVCQPCPAGQYRYNNTCVTTCPPELDTTIIVDGVCTYMLL